ncbi:MAG: histidine phosphatase family protein [Oscillospiraceae bacterium]|nr:histidine phosphatase family protein [Oscillospiraceae bacterium]
MTHIYFVRHAQPIPNYEINRTRPLSDEGRADCSKVCDCLKDIKLDYAVSSPFIRSVDTIKKCAEMHGLEIETNEDFRERTCGRIPTDKHFSLTEARWADFDFCEEGGENIRQVQERNMRSLKKLLTEHEGESILFGTHGTALSTILNYYDRSFGYNDFMAIVDMMPYIIRLDFDGDKLIGKEVLLEVYKQYNSK